MPKKRKCEFEGCTRDHYARGFCRTCYMREYYRKVRREQDTEEKRKYNLEYWKKNPAKNHYRRAQGRCLYDKNSSYYGRVAFRVTPQYVEEIWDRDRAYLLSYPSIDRIDSSKGYIRGNIQFIEMSENKRKPRSKRVSSIAKNLANLEKKDGGQ